jgi:hypothetical protein
MPFQNTNHPPDPPQVTDVPNVRKLLLLQLRVLGFGLLQDGDVGVGVFREGAEKWIPIGPTSQFGFADPWLKFSTSHTSDASAATLTMI